MENQKSFATWRYRITEEIEEEGEIIERHTRHYADLREDTGPVDFWQELVEWADDVHGINLEKVADRGEEYKEKHGLKNT